MAELRRADVAVITVLGSTDACEVALRHANTQRINADEVMVWGRPPGDLASTVAAADPHASVEDVTDGWTAFVLEGAMTREAFARFSELELPDEGFVQGEAAHIAVRVRAEAGRLTLLVPAMWGDHLEERIRVESAGLQA